MQSLKWFLVGFAIAVVCMVPAFASTDNKHVDLQGAQVLAHQACTKIAEPKVQLYCVMVVKDGKMYLIILDAQGEKEISDENGVIWFRDVT